MATVRRTHWFASRESDWDVMNSNGRESYTGWTCPASVRPCVSQEKKRIKMGFLAQLLAEATVSQDKPIMVM